MLFSWRSAGDLVQSDLTGKGTYVDKTLLQRTELQSLNHIK